MAFGSKGFSLWDTPKTKAFTTKYNFSDRLTGQPQHRCLNQLAYQI
jgi:hypothetical protein